METFNIATIVISIVAVAVNVLMIFKFGPVQAARLTRDLQREGAQRDRKADVFRRLAATRGARLNPDHVWALNLIPIEFSNIPAVMQTWRTYLEHLNFKLPQDEASKDAFFHERDKRLMALIEVIATDVGIVLDRLDIQKYSYTPQGWEDDEFDQKIVRKLSINMLRGLAPLRVAPMPPPGEGPFPPPPTTEPTKVPSSNSR